MAEETAADNTLGKPKAQRKGEGLTGSMANLKGNRLIVIIVIGHPGRGLCRTCQFLEGEKIRRGEL